MQKFFYQSYLKSFGPQSFLINNGLKYVWYNVLVKQKERKYSETARSIHSSWKIIVGLKSLPLVNCLIWHSIHFRCSYQS